MRPFETGDETAFRVLNEQWIEHYFELETKDRSMLADPQSSIIDRGGKILIATSAGRSVGCCALLCMGGGEFEVSKMAVSPKHQGQGIWTAAALRSDNGCSSLGCEQVVYLETNHILKPAIALYQSLGFRHIDPARVVPSPYARADVYMELLLSDSSTEQPL